MPLTSESMDTDHFTTMHLLAVLLIVAPRHVQPFTSLLFTRIFNSLLIDSSSFLASLSSHRPRSTSGSHLQQPSDRLKFLSRFLPTIHQRSVVLNVFLIIANNKEFIASLFPLPDASLTSTPIFTRLCRILSDLVSNGSFTSHRSSSVLTLSASLTFSATPDHITTFGEVLADVKKEYKVEDCDLAVWRTHFSVVADLKEQIMIASTIFTALSPNETNQHLLPPPKLRSLPDASPATPEEPPAPPKKTYSPRSVAIFLRIAALDTETVGGYLCINKPFNKLVLREYYNMLDLSPLTLDEVLRVMMTSFRASGEGQVMDRLMDILGEIIEPTFRKGDEKRRGKKQEEANEPLDREITVDDAYVAGFTLTLLNSNRHNVNGGQKEKMSLDKFIEQVYKIGNKEVFTVDGLERLFTSIELNPFIPLQSTPAPVFEPVLLNSLADNAVATQIGTVDDILHLLWSVVAHLSNLPNDFILPLPHFGLLKSTSADVEKGESTAQKRSSKFIQAAYASALRNPFTFPTPSKNRKIISNNHLLSTIVQLFSIANKNIVLVEYGWAEIPTSFDFLFSLGLISPEMLASVISPSQNNLKDHINPQSSIASPASDRIRHAPTVASPGTTAQQLPRHSRTNDGVVKQEDALRAARATFSASDLSELLRTVRSLTAEHQEIFVLTLITSLFHVTLPVLSRKEDTNTSSEAGEEVKLTPVNNHTSTLTNWSGSQHTLVGSV
ncbi:putative Sec7 domain containing protein [Blattamonas nauphoetae]|uniref:Sec7 domain containing protein n=1 Tax=Blattamonas nauphoetae TaxID=2049346 RepID=A0ABQ9XPA4_9EUKA|nr:putative Sec7 domain containing protein [Blattamonas nauphoetae]